MGRELVTLVERAFVSQQLRNGNFSQFLTQPLQGVIPPAGAPGRAALLPGMPGSGRNSSAISTLSCFLSPRGCNVFVKAWIFRQLTSLNDGFSRLVVITHGFHMDPGMFQRAQARGFSSVPDSILRNHRVMECFGVEGTLKPFSFHPLPRDTSL